MIRCSRDGLHDDDAYVLHVYKSCLGKLVSAQLLQLP